MKFSIFKVFQKKKASFAYFQFSKIVRSYKLKVKSSSQREEGQVLIVLILTLAVVALVVLAVASRSITDIKISQTSEESARAFSAAEAGVENGVAQIRAKTVTLNQDVGPTTLANNAAVTYRVEAAVSSQAFLSSTPLDSDVQIFQVVLADYNNGNIGGNNYTGSSLCLFWGNGGAPSAIEASLFYQDSGGALAVKRFPIDGSSPPRAGFTGANNDVSSCGSKTILSAQNNLNVDRTFQFSHKLDFGLPAGSTLLLMRLRLLFSAGNAHYIGVSPIAGGPPLPSQGYKISSTGQVAASQTTRKVQVFVSYPALPSIFDFVLFNGSSNQLSK